MAYTKYGSPGIRGQAQNWESDKGPGSPKEPTDWLQVMIGEGFPDKRARAKTIVAHEIIHVLTFQKYGLEGRGADIILVEGIATWGAGKEWLGSQPDFKSYVRDVYHARGSVYALDDANYWNADGSGFMADIGEPSDLKINVQYGRWASVCQYIIEKYGWEKFDKLYVATNAELDQNYQLTNKTGTAVPYTHQSFKEVLGVSSFKQFEDDWNAWLLQR